jgi:RNA polymerase sigma-70 factor, ECF subfamily
MYSDEIVLSNYKDERSSVAQESTLEGVDAEASMAFEEIFARYNTMVFRLTHRLLGDYEEALDVSQEVFLTVYQKMKSFRGESSLKTWIYRIAINRASNRFRWWNRLRRRGTISLDEHLSKELPVSFSDSLESNNRTPEENLLLEEEREEIERSLLQLPVSQRIALVMRDVEGMSYEEIAESMQVSLGTVKSRIARGRDDLKRRLNGRLG